LLINYSVIGHTNSFRKTADFPLDPGAKVYGKTPSSHNDYFPALLTHQTQLLEGFRKSSPNILRCEGLSRFPCLHQKSRLEQRRETRFDFKEYGTEKPDSLPRSRKRRVRFKTAGQNAPKRGVYAASRSARRGSSEIENSQVGVGGSGLKAALLARQSNRTPKRHGRLTRPCISLSLARETKPEL
jgi:hypothetical protein